MSGHDPLCPLRDERTRVSLCPYCPVIAKVRADEQEKIAQAIEAQATPHCDDDRSCACAGCTAYDEAMCAARIAREGTP